MGNVNIAQFKQFKKEYQFKGILEEYLILERVRSNTFLHHFTEVCNEIEAELTKARRSIYHKEMVIFLSYVLYLCEFTSGIYANFDKIAKSLEKDTNRYVDSNVLKEILNYA